MTGWAVVRTTTLAAFVLILLGAPLCAAERNLLTTERFPAIEGKRVVVDAGDLDVNIRSADIVDIEVTTELRISGVGAAKAEKWIEDHTPTFSDANDELAIVIRPQETVGVFSIGRFTSRARLAIIVPMHVIPDITTAGGAIVARGDFASARPFRMRTLTGDIEFTGAAGSFDIRSSSGATRLDLFRSAALLFARTASGSVTLTGGAGEVAVDTASGGVSLAGLSGSARVATSTGRVSLGWDRLDADHEVKVRSSSGKVHVVLPGGVRPRGRLATTTGSIESDLPGTFSPQGDRYEFSGEGPVIDIETASTPIVVVAAGVHSN
jgi:DUF4097 and DUF4098 domain-containing protein YvlB